MLSGAYSNTSYSVLCRKSIGGGKRMATGDRKPQAEGWRPKTENRSGVD